MRSVLKFFRSVSQRGFTQLKVLVLAFLMVGIIGAAIDLGTSYAGAEEACNAPRFPWSNKEACVPTAETRIRNILTGPASFQTPDRIRTPDPTPIPTPTPPTRTRPFPTDTPTTQPFDMEYISLANEILTNPKIDLFCYKSETTGDYPYSDIYAASENRVATNGVMVDIRILEVIAQAGRTSNGRTCVSSIQNHGKGHSTGSAHYKGIAVDFNWYNGVRVNGRDAASKALMQAIATDPKLQLPQITGQVGRFGQVQCGSDPWLNGWYQFSDACGHLHVDFCYVPSGTNTCTYEPVVPWTSFPAPSNPGPIYY